MIVLASQSPRRKEILAQAGIPFTVRVPAIEEVPSDGEAPEAYVERLAREKAAAVPASPDEWVLAADTTVVADGHILEKPHSAADAARMLRFLSGREHVVLTGVCLRHSGREWAGVESTAVRFSALAEADVEAYAGSGEPMDKAGGYAIQGLASKYIERIDGCYYNVVGLPVSRVYRMLRAAGYPG
jgi:septum formation protein